MELSELKKQNQWLNWVYKQIENRTTKIPISYKGQKTGSNKVYQDTWTSFEQAKQNTDADGVGIVLNNGICGIDIDNRDINDPTTQDILNLMDTYTEYSPSGKGFHILFTVDTEQISQKITEKYYQKNPRNHIECYISGLTNRYFTFTENIVIDKPINERTQQLFTFLDRYMLRDNIAVKNTEDEELKNACADVLDIIIKSEQSDKFIKLYYEGDISQYNGDDSSADLALCDILAFYCGEDFEMIDKLFCDSKLYRAKWDRTDYKYKTIMKAIQQCNDNFYRNGINFRILEKLKQIAPEKKNSINDIGISDIYANIYKSRLRYNVTAKQWYYFNGKVWVEDTGSMIALQKMKELAKALLVYVSIISNDDTTKEFIKGVARLGTYKVRDNIVKDSMTKACVKQNDFDRNEDLLNCQNGTINLKTFEFQEHRPNDLLSKISNVTYDPNADCPLFKKFMNQIMENNKSKIDFLQKALGYSLTTNVSEETCFILYGKTTRNGKGTLMDTIAYMLGDYSTTAMPETLSLKKYKDSTRASGDIARLNECRFLNISEPSQQMIIDSALLKTLLGRDKITARHLNQREFEFYPKFKLFINCNYLPIINDNTVFNSGRINVITFDRHFKPYEQDKKLKDKLKQENEISGIFNWCLEGLRKYKKEGLKATNEIKEAVLDYEKSNDKFFTFFEQELIKSKDNVTLADLYERYKEWCLINNMAPQNKSDIKAKLKHQNLFKERATVKGKSRQNVIIGYELKKKDDSNS